MIVAYIMASMDNDSSMFDRIDSKILRCSVCGFVLNRKYIPETFKLRRKRFDLSVTFDHIHIASSPFRTFCFAQRISDLDFVALPNNKTHYVLRANRTVLIDRTRTTLKFEDYCEGCARYRSTGGALPLYLVNADGPLPTGIYATDLAFGSWDEREPFLIVSPDIREQIKKEKLKGMSFTPIEA